MLEEKLLDIRKDYGLNQEEIAQILKTSRPNYSRWENGIELIPLKKLTLLCNYFKVNMDYMVGLVRDSKDNGTHYLKSKVIGNNLKIFRKENHLTQKELANFLNTTQSTISAYESGKTILLTAFALQIVNEYKISLDWLCGRLEKKE